MVKGINFGKYVRLTAWENDERRINHNPKIQIGNNCNFGYYLYLICFNKIIIGDNLLTGLYVTITDNSHGNTDFDNLLISPIKRVLFSKGPTIIGNTVCIGDKNHLIRYYHWRRFYRNK